MGRYMRLRLRLPWYKPMQERRCQRWHAGSVRVFVFVVGMIASIGLLTAERVERYSVAGRRSGYTYLSEENQRLQDDDFANPGLLWVEQGRELWRQRDGATGMSCASCHGDAVESMRGVRTHYPRFDPTRGRLINLEQQINRCRQERMQVGPYPYESEALLALTTFVGFQSRGLPIDVRIDGPAAPFFAAGQAFFLHRR